MKPLSPILFLTAVQAVALRGAAVQEAEACALQFIDEMGTIAHLDGLGASSSWPLAGVRTVDALRRLAAARGMLRDAPDAGDVLIPRASLQQPAGVVMRVLQQGVGPLGRSARCRVAFGVPGPGGTNVRSIERWYAHGCGDDFVRWHEGWPRLHGLDRRAA